MTDTKEEMELVKKRASFKGRLTAFGNYLTNLGASVSPQQVNELQLRIGRIEQWYEQYDSVQLRLECIVDDINLQTDERTEFESNYYRLLAQARGLLECATKLTKTEDFGSAQSSRSSHHKLVKLPVIQLPKFSGSYENWLEFRDTYSSLIHSNEDIDEINKFHYLRASLEGSAAVAIQSIEFSSSNYSMAWTLLCERYNNQRLLVQNHVSALFNLDMIKTESSSSLKRLIDQINKSLRALHTLGEPTQHWDTLLIYMITRKLDQKTFIEWEEFKGQFDKRQKMTLSVLLDFIQNRADLLETLESSRGNVAQQHPKSGNIKLKTMVSVDSSQSQSANVRNNNNNTSPIKPCPQCKGDHNLYNCSQFLCLTHEQRLELIPQLKVCYNCFHAGHYANHCKKYGCKICKRKHNTLLHIADVKSSDSSCRSEYKR